MKDPTGLAAPIVATALTDLTAIVPTATAPTDLTATALMATVPTDLTATALMATVPTDLTATALMATVPTDPTAIAPTTFATATVGTIGGRHTANKSAQVSTATIPVGGIGMEISFGIGIRIFAGDFVSTAGLPRFGVRS